MRVAFDCVAHDDMCGEEHFISVLIQSLSKRSSLHFPDLQATFHFIF